MGENRRQILDMLSQGKITAEEAERLIAALEKPSTASSAGPELLPNKRRPKYMRVVVEASDHYHDNANPTKVNIRVPMALIRAGVRLSGLIPPEARARANAAMRAQGVDFDLNQIRPENLEEIINQLDDLEVNVDDNKAKVRIFCE